MILSDKDIRVLCTQPEHPLISPFDEFRLQGASYDVSMSDVIHVFKDDVRTISLTDQNTIDSLYKEVPIPDSSSFILKPMEYILVTLKETICIPSNMIAHIRPRTKFTRLGIIVSDQHCNPGYQGTLQIGLRNVSPNSIGLTADMPIAQIVFEELKEIRPDALIISDPGVFMIAREVCPEIDIHISTQANNTNYGTYQFPEKLIPLFINNIRHNKPLPVYGTGENVRDWLFVEDHARAIDLIFHKGKVGDTYNIGGFNEWKNIDLIKVMIKVTDRLLGRPEGTSEKLITYVTDRAGHDLRYAIDSTKLHEELGWEPSLQFEEGIEKTVKWYLENQDWLDNVTSGEYMKYYESMYNL